MVARRTRRRTRRRIDMPTPMQRPQAQDKRHEAASAALRDTEPALDLDPRRMGFDGSAKVIVDWEDLGLERPRPPR